MRLTHFGVYVFPLYNKRDKVSVGDTSGAMIPLVGGGFYDGYGTEDAPEAIRTVSTEYEIIETTATAVQTHRDDIRGRAGQLLRLWAQLPDSTVRFAWARLARVEMERRREYLFYQPIRLQFDIGASGWNGAAHGAPWFLDAGHYLESGKYLNQDDVWTPSADGDTEVVVNAGNITVTNAVLTITASGTATISNVRIRCGDCDWQWTGTVALSTSLVIDCGTRSVKNNTVDAYSGFALHANHKTADWLQLAPGNNTVTINYTGNANASATVTFDFYDGWM